MTFALDRHTAQTFYDALASRDPVRMDPFLDDDVYSWTYRVVCILRRTMAARAFLTLIGSCRGRGNARQHL
jgi:hypothetical protein